MHKKKKNILVLGGAGYIGSHTVLALLEQGYNPIVYDNLSSGHRDAIFSEVFIKGDLEDKSLLIEVLESNKIECVIHFAALIEAGQSVKDPLPFYLNNISGTLTLLDAMQKSGVQRIVFSSTAAVYGDTESMIPLCEKLPKRPINPYGASKSTIEDVLKTLSASNGLQVNVLRYFNAAGADPSGRTGERHNPETHLIPLVIEAAAGIRSKINIYGTDYKTHDGTCIRDFIHVSDLAQAHVLALQNLLETDQPTYEVFNVGSGNGYTVMEVINAVKKISEKDFDVQISERRPGDPSALVSNSELIKSKLGWEAKRSEIHQIVEDAWNYTTKLQRISQK